MGRSCGHPECERLFTALDNAHRNFNKALSRAEQDVLTLGPRPQFVDRALQAVDAMRDIEAAARELGDAIANLRANVIKVAAEKRARMGQVVPPFPGAAS